jgi:hypothetical protein
MNAEADSTGTSLFMYSSNSRTYFSCAQRNLLPPQAEASSGGPLKPGFGLSGDVQILSSRPETDHRKAMICGVEGPRVFGAKDV